jgi:hypothetical protein
MRRRLIAASFAVSFGLAACQPAPAERIEDAPAVTAPEPAVVPLGALTGAQLVDCGGAISAVGNVDPTTPPTVDTPASNSVWTILALLDKEPGLAGEAGRREVAAAKTRWAARPKEELAQAATACTTHFPG